MALLPCLAGYILFRPGVTEMLAQGGTPAARLVIRQVVTGGVPIVFVATWGGLVIYGVWRRAGAPRRAGRWVAFGDLPIRLFAFVVLHGAVYVLSAAWFGSFGGDRMTALSLVVPTLARAATFENISGAYLYATLLAALPNQIAAVRVVLGVQWRWAIAVAFAWTISMVVFLALSLTMAAQ